MSHTMMHRHWFCCQMRSARAGDCAVQALFGTLQTRIRTMSVPCVCSVRRSAMFSDPVGRVGDCRDGLAGMARAYERKGAHTAPAFLGPRLRPDAVRVIPGQLQWRGGARVRVCPVVRCARRLC